MLSKPTQDELDTCTEVLEYLIAECTKNEPHAVNTISNWEEALSTIPCADELGDL